MKTWKAWITGLLLTLSSTGTLWAQTPLSPAKQLPLLTEHLERYTQLADTKKWYTFTEGTCLRLGDSGVHVTQLRHNLLLTTDLATTTATSTSAVFDSTLLEGVRKFQQRHGILSDGIVGQQTLEALNMPPAQRLRQIELNLDRWRAFNELHKGRVVLVNIPEYMLHLLDSAHVPVWQTRVVVGLTGARYHTKTLHSTISSLIVNPNWNIPNSIIRNEIIPILKRDPRYLTRNHMQVYSQGNGRRTPPRNINWHDADPVRDNFTIKQKPGSWNALGRIKFTFPNPYSIYLHDTPAKALFAHQNRAYSHGCVRVQHPDSLALYLLNTDWRNLKDVSRVLKTTVPEKTVRLPEPIAISIGYYTCWVNEAGLLQFRKDIYSLDARTLKLADS